MKIIVLGTRGFPNVPGGIESHCEGLYPRLAKMGCEIIAFTRRPYADITRDSYKGIKLIHLFCLKNKFLEAFLHTLFGVFAARKLSPDILHIHGIGPSLFIPLARILGLKVVMTNHGPDYERKKWGGLAKFILGLGEYLGARFANGVICISRAAAERIREKYGRDTSIIPNGVALPQLSQKRRVIKKHDLTKRKYVLSVGRFVPEKAFHDLIKAFNHMDGWKLVIVGDANHPDKYSLGLKEEANKNSSIVLPGFLTGEPLRQLYSQAGLFVLPSYYEGLPIVLLEAMSYGLSCIASDIPANKDIGLDNSRFFKVGDVKSLALKIKKFVHRPLTDREKRRQINMVAERYDWENIANRTFEVYRQVVNK